MTRTTEETTGEVWTALGGDPALARSVSYGGRVTGALPSRLPVAALARTAVAVCSLAAAELAARRSGHAPPAVRVDDGAVATAFTSERHLRIDGRAPVGFAPHSGFWQAGGGWVRTHANYPHHRDRLLGALGLPLDAGAGQLADAIRPLPAEEVEERVYAAGGLAVAVRAAGERPGPAHLLETGRVAGSTAPPREFAPLPSGVLLPAHGIRVLDLTRVTAGPVATRTLGLLGADVLRIDSPGLPESEDAHADTGFGKRSVRLDLAAPADRAVFGTLLESADVVVTGYRPGALDRLGLSVRELTAARPGLVIAGLRAWEWSGPWAPRRGFDSLVQAGSGIARIEAGEDGRPGALPAQALDHGTGYLLAAAVLRSLTDQSFSGGARLARFSLAATARWLTGPLRAAGRPGRDAADGTPPGAASVPPYDPAPWLAGTDAPAGRLVHALPPVDLAGGPRDWARPPSRWGSDEPVWLPR
jgi:CoA-transferase family III